MSTKDFPFEITPVEDEIDTELRQYFKAKDYPRNVRVGPRGYFLPEPYQPQAASIYHLPLRPDDTFVITYPRSGTTWTQELVWLIKNNLDFEIARKLPLLDRYVYPELSTYTTDSYKRRIKEKTLDTSVLQMTIVPAAVLAESTPSPRFFKCHLPLSLLPPNLLDTVKVVYVARDPRDVLISMYYLSRGMSIWDFVGDFDTYFDLFVRNLTLCTPLFEHVKEAWNKRQHPNLCFIFYEDLKKDLMGTCGRVAEFFGKQYSHEQLEKLVKHLQFDNFKNNQALAPDRYKSSEIIFKQDIAFVRTGRHYNAKHNGKSGGWRQYMSEEQQRRAALWIQDNLQDTDLKYPEV